MCLRDNIACNLEPYSDDISNNICNWMQTPSQEMQVHRILIHTGETQHHYKLHSIEKEQD